MKSQHSQSSACCHFSKAAQCTHRVFHLKRYLQVPWKWGGAADIACLLPVEQEGGGGCRLGYGDMVWRVRVNRGKGVMLHNLPNSPQSKFATKGNNSICLCVKGLKVVWPTGWTYGDIMHTLHRTKELEGEWKWGEWNILHCICKPNGVKDYQMKPSYKMRP